MRMLMRDKAAVESGELTLTFRRWKRPQVVAGRLYRTVVGRLAIDEVDVVPARSISADDARRAGYPSVAALLRELPGDAGLPVHRIAFHMHDGPDERDQLAHDADPGPTTSWGSPVGWTGSTAPRRSDRGRGRRSS